MGAYGGELQKVLAIGGDDELARAGEKANRFKPVVIFSGPFTLKAGNKVYTSLRYLITSVKYGLW